MRCKCFGQKALKQLAYPTTSEQPHKVLYYRLKNACNIFILYLAALSGQRALYWIRKTMINTISLYKSRLRQSSSSGPYQYKHFLLLRCLNFQFRLPYQCRHFIHRNYIHYIGPHFHHIIAFVASFILRSSLLHYNLSPSSLSFSGPKRLLINTTSRGPVESFSQPQA